MLRSEKNSKYFAQDCSIIFFYENTLMIYEICCAIAKSARTELRMGRVDIINNAYCLVIDGCNVKCLFILHALGKCIIAQS